MKKCTGMFACAMLVEEDAELDDTIIPVES